MNLNPMGLTSGAWGGNYVQPNSSNPSAPVGGTDITGVAKGANMLNLTWPIATYTQPADPHTPPPAWNGQYVLNSSGQSTGVQAEPTVFYP